MPVGAQRVGEPGHERRLGPDHHQIGMLASGERDLPVEVVGGDRLDARDAGDAGVAGRGDDLVDLRAARQTPASACSRPPPPTTSTFIEPPSRVLAGSSWRGVYRGAPVAATAR